MANAHQSPGPVLMLYAYSRPARWLTVGCMHSADTDRDMLLAWHAHLALLTQPVRAAHALPVPARPCCSAVGVCLQDLRHRHCRATDHCPVDRCLI